MTALAGWPYAQHSAEINGHTMAYVDEGAGPPVLLVHGNPTWSFYYRSLLARPEPVANAARWSTVQTGMWAGLAPAVCHRKRLIRLSNTAQ